VTKTIALPPRSKETRPGRFNCTISNPLMGPVEATYTQGVCALICGHFYSCSHNAVVQRFQAERRIK